MPDLLPPALAQMRAKHKRADITTPGRGYGKCQLIGHTRLLIYGTDLTPQLFQGEGADTIHIKTRLALRSSQPRSC